MATEDTVVYIFGESALFNGLLARYVQELLQVEPVTAQTLDLRQYVFNDTAGKRFVLLDCGAADPDEVCSHLHGLDVTDSRATAYVLLNVGEGQGLSHHLSSLPIQGIFFQHDGLEFLRKGLQEMLKGGMWFSRQLMTDTIISTRKSSLAHRLSPQNPLTPREQQILDLVVAGLSNADIAKKLYISTNTVKTHLSNIYDKINVPNRVQAILWASKNL